MNFFYMKRIFWCKQIPVSGFCLFYSTWNLKIKIITFGNVSQISLFTARCTIPIATSSTSENGSVAANKKRLYKIENVEWEISFHLETVFEKRTMIYLQLLYTYTQRILIKIENALSLEFILKCVFEKLRSRAMSHFVLNIHVKLL